MFTIAGGACAADFSDLAIKASSLKNSTETETLILTPAGSALPPAAKQSNPKWYGVDSRQARMQFTAYMVYKIPASYTGAASGILSNPAQAEKIRELVDFQLQHMYGAFTLHPGFENNPGIPSGDYKFKLLGAEKVPNAAYAKITY